MEENLEQEIQDVLKRIRTNFNLQEDDLAFVREMWENGRMNLIIIMPQKISGKICSPCLGVQFSQWFRKTYPNSIISHVSFSDINSLNL